MVLGPPWDDFYLEHQKRNSLFGGLYINHQKPTKIIPTINPMELGAPWAKAYIYFPKKEQSFVIII